ncbi:MAG TPA: AAA family ATPase [Candidatus Nanoarchaeia archaeon]|nr:AAA family ATPase [Candidatus Nanoarchaeia archaeon]
MIITISGTPGSGKSTVAKLLVKALGAERIYVGGMRRELAKERGITLIELNEYAKIHPETDVDVDKKASELAKKLEKEGKIVIAEGHTQFYFFPDSIKIFIKVDPDEAARRIWKDLQQKETREARNEGSITSLEQMKQRVQERLKEDNTRYKKYYGLDYLDESHYELVIDSTTITAEQVTEKILSFLKSKGSLKKKESGSF